MFVLVALIGVVLDQASKRWTTSNLDYLVDEVVVVPDVFSLVHHQNTGAAFSILEGQIAFFLVLTCVAIAVLVDMVRRLADDDVWAAGIIGLLMSGVIGNGIDRALHGHVTDMLKVYAGTEPARSWFIETFSTNVWPIFNLADVWLVVGAIVFAIHQLVVQETEPQLDEPVDETAS